jgi:putative DNA primase/helicase
VSDPNTWTDFQTALQAYEQGRFDGIGFVLTPEAGIVCVDIDHAKNGTDWTPEAMAMVGALNSYTEVSPSGKGLHIWCYGHLPAGRRRKNGVEMYDSGRFITVTGDHLPNTPGDLQERTAELAELHRRIFGETTSLKVTASVDLSDAELIQRAMDAKDGAKFRALWNGDTTGYPSESEAVLALCRIFAFWTGGDAERIERLVSQSALGQREKWRTRADYRQRTIQKALQSLRETYNGNGLANGHTTTSTSTPTSSANRPADVVEPEKIYRHYMHLADLLRNCYRWCPEWKTWLTWTGRVWERVSKEEVVTHAVEILRDYYTQRLQNTSREEAEKWAKRLNDVYSTKHVGDAIDLLSGHPDFVTRADRFDADPFTLNTPAGIVDLRTGQVRQHDPDALCTRMTHGSPEPQARAERWERFLREIFAGDVELIAYVQKVCASAMLGYNREQVLYILYGTGANGKSVFLNTLLWVLGDYAGNIPRDALLVQSQAHDARRTAYVSLVGVRFAVLDELEDRSRLSSTALKDLTSNNPQAARALYENYRQIQLGCTPFVGTNAKPEVTEHSLGTWRRLRLIPFVVTIPPEQRDAELESKLRAEAAGIMQWLLEGLRAYWREGLVEPAAVAQATQEYRSEEDALAEWLAERTESHPKAVTPAKDLWEDYKRWTEDHGIADTERLGEQAFARQLTAHGYPQTLVRVGGRPRKVRRGIRLRAAPLPTQDEGGVTECNPIPQFSENSLRESDSREVFQNAGNSVTSGYTCVSETPQNCVSETSTTPPIEAVLAGGNRMTRLELYRATGLPPSVFKEAFEHMVTTGQLVDDRGDYLLPAHKATSANENTEQCPNTTPVGYAIRAIEAVLASGKRMRKHELQRATGLPPSVLEEALQHMLNTGELIAEAGLYQLQEAMDDG